MLPDFPEVRRYANDLLHRRFQRHVSRGTGILQQMKARPLREGDDVEFHRRDGSVDHVPMQHVGSTLELRLDDLRGKGLWAVLEALDKTAADIAAKQSSLFFKRLDEICDESGQSVDAKGRPLSFDLLIEQLDMIDIDFDESGNPLFPTFVSSEKTKALFDQMGTTDEQNERLERLIEEKRIAWRDRESNRRLVG